MTAVSHHRIGQNLEADARYMQNLCIESAKDAAIMGDFWQTVEFYATADLPDIEQRITDRYIIEPTIGDIVTVNGREAGLVFAYPYDFKLPQDYGDIDHGANVSLWLLHEYRNKGLGKQILRGIVDEALLHTADQANEDWFNRTIWTGIANGNGASQAVCKAIGFKRLCADPYDEDRAVYVIPQL